MKLFWTVCTLLVFLSCTPKKTDSEAEVQDSVSEEPQVAESDSIGGADEAVAAGDVDEAAELEREANDGDYFNEAPQNPVDVADGIVRFVDSNSEIPFRIGMPWGDPVNEVPQFLKDNKIKYTLKKEEADPNDPESTDYYQYTFGNSTIEISYSQVTRADINTPEIALDREVKVGMEKSEFLRVFGYLDGYKDYDSFQLHTSSLTSACYLQFTFDNDQLVNIKLSVFVQDCG